MEVLPVLELRKVFLFSLSVFSVLAFNVDTKSALVFSGPKNSYFGYSVGILENSQGTWLLVGAPRANDSSLANVYQPGAVFQCNWQYRSSCEPVFIDNIGNERQIVAKPWKKILVKHNKNNQWLGASIDINVQGDSSVLICAPRWTDTKHAIQGFHMMNGLCYEADKELVFNESSAIPALASKFKQIHRNGYYLYGMGSLGVSAVYSKDGRFSVLGAPGLNDYSGGYAVVEDKDSRPHVLEISKDLYNTSYFGVSVTTAKLSADELAIIIGGPRAEDKGMITVFKKDSELMFVKEGEQLGSGYGSSLCAADLNGDGLDDIIVGAPYYSEQGDEGRVYVYMNRALFFLELSKPLLKGSNAPGARFGSAVANVGDLNLDSYEDIAVGAPYEDESGVVYIYNGAKTGLHSEPSQRIVGKELLKGLRTFGSSFSRPHDVDSNLYQDFAVGAFESNKVILFRTRSVFDLNGSLEAEPAVINQKGRGTCTYKKKMFQCLDLTICLNFSGRNLPPAAEVNVTIRLDTIERLRGERSRLFFVIKNKEVETVTHLITIKLNKLYCFKHHKAFVRSSRDVLTPLRMELDYNIATDSIGIASLCKICPAGNLYNPTTAIETVYFSHNCRSKKCAPDLRLKAYPIFDKDKEVFTIDDNPTFDLEIAVTNQGDTSYFTLISIEFPSSVHYSSVWVIKGEARVICTPVVNPKPKNDSRMMIECDLVTPLKEDKKVVFQVQFYAHGVPYDVKELEMNVAAKSGGYETVNSSKSSSSFKIKLHMESHVKMSGMSLPGHIELLRKKPSMTKREKFLTISHLYALQNFGPSPIPHAHLKLSIPKLKGIEIQGVHIKSHAASESNHVPVECNILSKDVTTTEGENNNDMQVNGKDFPATTVTCENRECAHVSCYLGIMHMSESVYINISLTVRRDILEMWKVSNELTFLTNGAFAEPEYSTFYKLHSTHNASAITHISYVWQQSSSISWWILAISIASGLLLLYLICLVLWKCGFFKRKKRDELKLLIKSTESEREILHSDSLSACSNDIMVLPPGHNGVFSGGMNGSRNSEDFMNHNHFASTILHAPRGTMYDEDMEHERSAYPYNHSNYFRSHTLRSHPVRQNMPPQTYSFNSLPRPQPMRSRGRRNFHSPPQSPYQQPHYQNNTSDNEDLWVPAPKMQLPPPSFNNEMYLEPVEMRA